MFHIENLSRDALDELFHKKWNFYCFRAIFCTVVFNSSNDVNPPKNWLEAFNQVQKLLEATKPVNGNKKIIFIDELPWLDTPQSNFITALEYFWNSWASAQPDVILIVCGSAASWMINKLIQNTRGLYNRVTHHIKLEPFTLRECEQYFEHKSAAFNRFNIVQLYMVLGGIPFYLQQVDTRLSADQNINNYVSNPGEFSTKNLMRFINRYLKMQKSILP